MARIQILVLFLSLVILPVYGSHSPDDNFLSHRFGGKSHRLNRRLFEHFVRKHNKSYENDASEKEKRFKIFHKNLLKIDFLNRHEKGTAVYGVTKFADLTVREFKKCTGLRRDLVSNRVPKRGGRRAAVIEERADLPKSFDWRDRGAVSEVKDQGMCGSCWAFSTTGNIEGQYAIRKGKLISLSEQELVACDTLDAGCDGGYMTNAYKSVIEMGGLETEADYPYEGLFGEKCHYNKTLAKVDIDSYVVLPENETLLANWLVSHGPISIGINAQAMQFYFGGVSHPWKWACSPKKIDHGVLIVGFGETTSRFKKKTIPYWIVKNSWGHTWGKKGYYLVYRGDGTCGLNTMATSAWIN